jgi:hypothetical protein
MIAMRGLQGFAGGVLILCSFWRQRRRFTRSRALTQTIGPPAWGISEG